MVILNLIVSGAETMF